MLRGPAQRDVQHFLDVRQILRRAERVGRIGLDLMSGLEHPGLPRSTHREHRIRSGPDPLPGGRRPRVGRIRAVGHAARHDREAHHVPHGPRSQGGSSGERIERDLFRGYFLDPRQASGKEVPEDARGGAGRERVLGQVPTGPVRRGGEGLVEADMDERVRAGHEGRRQLRADAQLPCEAVPDDHFVRARGQLERRGPSREAAEGCPVLGRRGRFLEPRRGQPRVVSRRDRRHGALAGAAGRGQDQEEWNRQLDVGAHRGHPSVGESSSGRGERQG